MVRVAIALLLSLLLLPSAAHAEARIALVITNQAYTQSGARLTNTHRDGDVVKAALEKVGFKVWVAKDTTNERALLETVAQHVQRLAEAGPDAVGFFYYSGHGAADRPNGENFLIPTDVPLTHVAQLPLLAVRLEKITSTLATAGRMSFVVFDACRNVPLQRADKDLAFKGFAPVREQRGLLVAFATDPGNVAVDQSVYAKALADEIVKPGLEAGQVFRAVTRRVLKDTQDKQSPEYLDKRLSDFHFAAAVSVADREVAALREQLARLESELKRQQQTGAGTAKEMSSLKEALAKSDAELKRREEEQKTQQVTIAAPPPKSPVATPSKRTKAKPEEAQQAALAPPLAQAEARSAKAVFASTCTACHRSPESLGKDRSTTAFLRQHYAASDAEAAALAKYISDLASASRPVANVAPQPRSSVRHCDGVEALVANEKRCLKPKDVFKDCDTCPEMVVVPAGEFMMGSEKNPNEKPVHKVTIAKPFAVGKFEVTFAEWDACISERGCKHTPDDRNWGRGDRPVMRVSWDDITNEYLPWLSRKTGNAYRLLTEAEWEYAARAGSRSKYSWGDEIGKNHANCDGCGSQWDTKQTAPIGSFQANRFGLYDMHGNVWEWVADCYKDSYANAPSDGRGAPDVPGCSRVIRGGSWSDGPGNQRYGGYTPGTRGEELGFRLARTLNP